MIDAFSTMTIHMYRPAIPHSNIYDVTPDHSILKNGLAKGKSDSCFNKPGGGFLSAKFPMRIFCKIQMICQQTLALAFLKIIRVENFLKALASSKNTRERRHLRYSGSFKYCYFSYYNISYLITITKHYPQFLLLFYQAFYQVFCMYSTVHCVYTRVDQIFN